jgi:FAD/FMN-containing dehydrogenase
LKEVEDPKIAAGVIWRSVRITASIRECFRAGGSFTAALGGTHPFGEEVRYLEEVSKLKKDLIKKGILRDDGGYYLTWPHEHGHLGHAEILLQFHLTPEVAEAIEGFSGKATKLTTDMHYGVPHMVAGDEAHDIFGPHTMNYHLWMRKLKKAFDPKEVSDSAQYISAK